MFRKVVGLTACCLFLSWGLVAAPRRDAPGPVYYHASQAGDKSVFEVSANGRFWCEVAFETTDVQRMGTAVLVTKRRTVGDKDDEPPDRVLLSDGGVYTLSTGDFIYPTPFCLVRLPFKKGETWETTHSGAQGETIQTKYTSVGEEEVEVPAGKFRSLRIEMEAVHNGETESRTNWYAPGPGLVQAKQKYKDQETTYVLKSFTPGSK